MKISAEKINSSKKKRNILTLVSINHQFGMTFCATVVERFAYYLYSIKHIKYLQSLAV